MAIFKSRRSRALYVRAMTLLVGAIFTPIALGLSSVGLAAAGPILVYGGMAAVMGYRRPAGGYLWGLFLAEGMLLAYLAVGLALVAWQGWDRTVETALTPFLRQHLPLGFLPALAGGIAGGFVGSWIARR